MADCYWCAVRQEHPWHNDGREGPNTDRYFQAVWRNGQWEPADYPSGQPTETDEPRDA